MAPRGTLHHVEIYVADLERSQSLWGWLLPRLGYSLYQSWAQGRSWRLGDTYLVFVQARPEHAAIPFHRCRPGLNHLAFHVNDTAEVDDFTRELRERGFTILYEDRHPYAGGEGYCAVFFEDPDRLKVELVATGDAGDG